MKFYLLLLLYLFSTNIFASILIEPHFGVTPNGSGTTSPYEYSYNGSQYGLRLGGTIDGFMAGVDYNVSNYSWERKSTTNTYNDKFKRAESGVFFGYELPLIVRGWVGYYLYNKAKDQDASGLTGFGHAYSGRTTEFALGYTGVPFVSINMAYRLINIDTDRNVAGFKIGTSIKNSEVVLSVSTPFTLL